ncbi:MAG: homoserine kinase [Gemmatimonadetes bacterium]|nr:homoserine kinase [Gemmatimonadota bacterium]
MSRALRPARVRVPGSTSNMGGGFDCVGLALDLFLDAEFEPGDDALRVVREGGDAPGGDDLLEAAFRRELGIRGFAPAGTLHVKSDIPVARGLGSSAAALVAGSALGALAAGEALDPGATFAAAAEAEGHGDNAAPSAYGGLLAVVAAGGAPRALPMDLSPEVGFAFAAPPTRVSTRDARTALPATVSHAEAVAALPRVVALLRGLATADPELIGLGFGDTLHVPHRLRLIPGGEEALAAAVGAGAWGATVSGSGSGLLAVGALDVAPALAEAMRAALAERHGEAAVDARPVRPVQRGVSTVDTRRAGEG